jgi:hypothetical protein
MHARYVEQLGASYNADTSFDRTRYYQTVPSHALARVLFLEADRMASLIVDEANMKSERDVVKEEYRQRVANTPYGNLLTDVLAQVFPEGHPYAHPTIGSIPDLDAAISQIEAALKAKATAPAQPGKTDPPAPAVKARCIIKPADIVNKSYLETPGDVEAFIKDLRPPAKIYAIEGGDHSFKAPKKLGLPQEQVYEAAMDEIVRWAAKI